MKNRIRQLNNKGFSLVELIVAVAILAVAAAPLLHSFVTAARMDRKGQQVTTASLAAQNIQEVLTASPLEDVLDGSCFAAPLGVNVETKTGSDGVPRFLLKNVSAAGTSYDALVSIDKNVYESVNQSAVPVFSAMDAVFTQPNGENNPDTLAFESFSAFVDGDSSVDVSRTITLDISKNEANDKAYASVEYKYTNPFYKDITQVFVFNILPNGYPLTDDQTMNLFLMYYPWTKSATETIIINNQDDVPVNIYLVSQTPENKSQQLYVKQYQSRSYNRDEPTARLFCNNLDSLKKYQVFLGTVWYYDNRASVSENLTSENSQARLYGVEISLYEPTSNNEVYTLKASKLG